MRRAKKEISTEEAERMMKERISRMLNLFPEVIWDRWNGTIPDITVFGWIKRDRDKLFDFVCLSIDVFGIKQLVTSSKRYSEEFSQRLAEEHTDCKRVEDFFEGVRCINLKTS